MTTSSFPVEYDTFPTAPVASAPGIPGTALASGHIDAHALLADAVAKLQRAAGKLGETDPVSIEYRLSSVITAADAAADAAAAAAVDAAVADAKGAAAQLGLSDLIADLGTAAYLNAGTGAGNLVQLAVAGQLPALDGSLLTGLAPGGVTDYADLTGKPTLGTAAATAATDYAVAAKGVTNGDAHDHNGGDGAQIAYASLSGTPTLGTAAAANTTAFEAAGAVSTHAALTTSHGISSFGATLVDDPDAATARTTLGLGSVDNTSDANKPVSTAQQTALNAKAPTASPTFTGTVGGITAAMVGAPAGSGTSTGTNTGDSATPAETTNTLGALTASATAKTTPADADMIPLMDSAASNILKKLPWANLVDSIRLLLFGTTSVSAKVHVISVTEQQRLGYDATNYGSTTVSSTGVVNNTSTSGQWTFKATSDSATLGSELITNGSFGSGLSGWTDSGSTWSAVSGKARHTAGSASTISQNVSVSFGSTYQLEFVISGRTAGSVSFNVGAVPVVDTGTTTSFTSSNQKSVIAGSSGSVAFSVVPTSDFDGDIDDITLKNVVTGSNKPVITLQNAAGAPSLQALSSGFGNTGIGLDVHKSRTTGTSNTAAGSLAQSSLTTGVGNTAVGLAAQSNLTIGGSNAAIGSTAQYTLSSGSNNTAIGSTAQYNITSGGSNSAIGNASQYSLVTGSNNVAFGHATQYGMSSGSGNTCLGYNAERYLANGSSSATSFDNCVHVGANTKVSANGVTNENVFGYNATGLGSNTCAIGSSAVTKTKIFGTPILMPVASSVPTVNGELTIEATSNTSLTFRLKGTDGTVRSSSLTLS